VSELARVLKPEGECLVLFPSRFYPAPPASNATLFHVAPSARGSNNRQTLPLRPQIPILQG
jgi:ubiquinone/menaquinone biosynthesis C-methylase UbiE